MNPKTVPSRDTMSLSKNGYVALKVSHDIYRH